MNQTFEYKIIINKGENKGQTSLLKFDLIELEDMTIAEMLIEKGILKCWCNQNEFTIIERNLIINDNKNEHLFLKFAEWFHGFDLIKVSDGLYMDKRCDKWNVRDLLASFRLSLISDKPKETYKKHAENGRHTRLHVCPNCDWPCICQNHPCSCCDEDN